MDLFLSIENIVIAVELIVVLFLLWHTNELRKTSRESEKVIKEMEVTHGENSC